jgi:outer membrane protein assembly factor BamB
MKNLTVKKFRLASTMLMALALAGCGTVADPTSWFGEGESKIEPTELKDITSELSVQTLWKTNIGSGFNAQRLKLEPRIDRGRLFVADADGLIKSIEAGSGTISWSIDTELPLSGGPGSGEGIVVVGTSDGEVLALREETGEQLWKVQVSSEVLSVPAMALGVVVVHTIDGKLFGLNISDGSQRWLYSRDVPVLTLRGTSSPIINGNRVYCGFAGGKLVALNLDNGELLWESSVTTPSGRSELERMVDIDGDPLVTSGAIFVTTYQGEVAAVSEYSGKVAWRRKLSSYSGIQADWRYLYVSDDVGNVWGINPENGAAMWKQSDLTYRSLSSAAVVGGKVVVGDFEGYLHWMDHATGGIVARSRVGSDAIISTPQVYNGVVYVYNSDGTLAALQPAE